MGKLKVENPQLSVYYICHRDHVAIIIQSSSQALSIISTCYTLIKLDLAKHMLQSLPLDSLPLLRNPCWRMPLDELELPQPCSRIIYRHLYWVLDANHASLIVTTDSHTCPSPIFALVSTETVHALKLNDVFFIWLMSL